MIDASPVPPLKFKAQSRARVLTDGELQKVWRRAEEFGYPYGSIVQLLILTCQRRGEMSGLRWDWIKDDTISIEQLKMIWEPAAEGKITKWNQIDPSWPDAEIKLFGPGADSGTFDYFTEVVCGKAKQSRGDFTASEDDNTLVQGIAEDTHALGYLPYAYYELNKAKM